MPAISQFPTKLFHTLRSHNAGPVNALTFSSYPGTYLLTGSSDRSIHLSRAIPATANADTTTETRAPIQRYDAHGYSVLDIAVARDNARFASVGGDKLVFLWDVETGGTVRRWSGHGGRVEAVEFGGEDDSVVVSGSADTAVNIWDARSSSTKPIQSLTDATDTVSSLHVHMPSYAIVSGSYDGRVRVYDLRMGRTTVDRLTQAIGSVRLSGDGNGVLVSTLDSRIRMLDREDGKLLKGFGTERADEKDSKSEPGSARKAIYRNSELRIRSVFAKGDAVVLSGSEVDMNTNTISNGNTDNTERLRASVFAWDVLSGELLTAVSAGDGVKAVSCVGWNEKERCWAGGCSDGSVKVYG